MIVTIETTASSVIPVEAKHNRSRYKGPSSNGGAFAMGEIEYNIGLVKYRAIKQEKEHQM